MQYQTSSLHYLLIAIAVAAAVLLYVFSIGLLGSLGSSGGQQTKEHVIMEAYSWPTLATLTVTLRNIGPAQSTSHPLPLTCSSMV